jgi:hypothetical protein
VYMYTMSVSLQIDSHASSDQVRECRGGCGRDGNVVSKMLPATPFYMVRSIWCRNHGSVEPPDRGVKLADLIRLLLLKVIIFLTMKIHL